MFERGVATTEADVWLFLCPLFDSQILGGVPRGLYSLRVHRFIRDIANYAHVAGRSKDGSETARGYLVPFADPCVRLISAEILPPKWNWGDLTDREAGKMAERSVEWMITAGYLNGCYSYIRNQGTTIVEKAKYDLTLFPLGIKVEIKCDRKAAMTGNLFVQSHEEGHRPQLTRDGQFSPSQLGP